MKVVVLIVTQHLYINGERGHGCKTLLSVSYLCSVLQVGLVQLAFNYDPVPLSAEELISICRTGNNFKSFASGPMASKCESHHVTPSKSTACSILVAIS